MAKTSIPVHLVTGFFGSGKTTLINHVLSTIEKDHRIAVLVNDFGDVDVDSEVIGAGSDGRPQVYGVAGGSIFCSCRHWEFVTGLHALANHKPDLVLVEASGMADPSPIKTDIKIASDLDPDHEYSYAGTICLVDASLFKSQLDLFPVVHRQVKHATVTVVNKVDLLREPVGPEKETIAAAIRRINRGARIEFTTDAVVSMEILLPAVSTGKEQARPDRSLNEPGNQPGKLVLVSTSAIARSEILTYYGKVKHEVLRFKGFCLLEDGWHRIDAVGDQIRIVPMSKSRARTEVVCIFDPKDESRATRLKDLWQQTTGKLNNAH